MRSYLFIPALGLVLGAFALNAASVFPNGFVEDDGYFYSRIAYNIGVHHLSSFDGVSVTSGYHLLWGWLLAAISWIAGLVTPSISVHLFAHLAAFYSMILLASWEATRRPVAAVIGIGGLIARRGEVGHVYSGPDRNLNPYARLNVYRLRRADCL
ncbi:hypothetical protein JL101_013790 [Skermanella rosea]|uniref:hypothetical protein n=1 Tax=Skermanella rosea TaxID=1817965 RepID=UPI001932D453|nr:hypothetical protein [Skermanella rosea]UEM06455.1 hypothetical protein JL101_013790 [Skermanella rosea]